MLPPLSSSQPMNNNVCVAGDEEGVLRGYNLSTGKALSGQWKYFLVFHVCHLSHYIYCCRFVCYFAKSKLAGMCLSGFLYHTKVFVNM